MLKVGATDLVLRMIEAGVVMRDLTLENPIRAIREVSHDMTGAARSGWPTAGRPARWRSRGSTSTRRATSPPGAASTTASPSGCSTCGSGAERGRDRRPEPRRARDRLGDQAAADRALPGEARPAAVLRRGSPSSTWPTTTSPPPAGCTTCWSARAVDRVASRPRDLRGQVGAAADHPGPAARRVHPAARRSGGATSPSTGCTSS